MENQLQDGKPSGSMSCSVCYMCGREYEQSKPTQKLCAGCVFAVIMEPEDSQKLRVRRLMGKHRAISTGNAGITPEGEIVDRRNYPEAMAYQPNDQGETLHEYKNQQLKKLKYYAQRK